MRKLIIISMQKLTKPLSQYGHLYDGGSGSVGIYKRKSVLTVQIILIIYSIRYADLCCIRAIRKLLCAIKQLYKNVISLVDC